MARLEVGGRTERIGVMTAAPAPHGELGRRVTFPKLDPAWGAD